MAERFWEVDAARGFALGLMLVFNWSFALRFFDVLELVPSGNRLYWWVFPRIIGFLFVFIVGVSLTLSVNRLRRYDPDAWHIRGVSKYAVRGLRIFAIGLGITVVTFALFPERYIYFGILHLIGFSIIVSIPFLTKARAALAAAIAVLLVTMWMETITVHTRPLSVIGFVPQLSTLDLFPIFPWTGVVLLGIWTGHVLFPNGARRVHVPEIDRTVIGNVVVWPLQFLGQHTLLIYLAHQPALVGILLVLGYEIL